MIELSNISVVFDHKGKNIKAVDDVSLSIDKGDIFGVVGFSGAGKSTLIRTINLLQRPTHGRVVIEGKDITKISERELRKERQSIGMIFQHFNLMNSRTVFDNVAYPLKNSKLSKEEKRARVNRLLKLVDIENKTNSYPSQLSGGQKQRVAIARALANDPKILLCDEATSSLDPQTTTQILKLLKSINQDLGITIVIITHEMEVVKEICNKVAIMERGRLVEEGGIFDIFARPQKETTKNFIHSVKHIDDLYEEIANFEVSQGLGPNKRLVRIKYIGQASQEPIIAELLKRYGVVANIIYGNLELIGSKPIGNLALVIEGDTQQIDRALKYIIRRGAIVEEIKVDCDRVYKKVLA
ncbi:methionine ABC transporter ATP-binding protein [Clostridium perfringens]|uniref:methionine ABC transporter ATP-binding protein n=1 Tax=Clostridium perfringens TaxID=1502 RepID=UPI0039E80FFD